MWAENGQDGWHQTLCQNHPRFDHPPQVLNIKKPLNTVPHVPHNIQIVLNKDSQMLLTIWFETVLMVWLTCIIDEQVQSWLRFEEVLSKSSHRFEASKIKLHEQDVIASCGLNNKYGFSKYSNLLNQWSEVMVLTFLMSFIAATAFFWFLQARMILTPRPARSRAVAFPIPVFPPKTSNQTFLKTKTKTRADFPQCPMLYWRERQREDDTLVLTRRFSWGNLQLPQ